MTRSFQILVAILAGLVNPAWCPAGPPADPAPTRLIATAGDVNGDGYSDVIVGVPLDSNGQTQEGRVFVYHGSPTGLSSTPAWTAEGNQAGAEFGSAVATAGDINGDGYSDVIIGAWKYDDGEIDEGRAYVYFGSSTGLTPVPIWTFNGDQPGAKLGGSVAPAGDVNGDGFGDLIIGAGRYSTGLANSGRAFAFHGSPEGLSTVPAWTADGDQASAEFGGCVATAGDVNGDGFADVIVGAAHHSNGETGEGRAFVFHGSPTGVSNTPAWTAEGNQEDARFARSVSTAGDVNGDGYSDVIIGSPLFDDDQLDEGRAFVFLGSASGLAASPAWTTDGNQPGAELGGALALAADRNGDGYCDVIIGAASFDTPMQDAGRVFVYHGSHNGLPSIATETFDGNQADAQLGSVVAPAGDVNGDGFADVIAAASTVESPVPGEIAGLIHHGSAAGLAPVADWKHEIDQAEAWYGWSIASAGDVNGDGYGDIIVGAINYDGGETNEGTAFVFHGSANGISLVPDWSAEGNQAFAEFGYAVGTAGDVNGDGYDDVLVGSPQYGNGEAAEGRAWLYLGSPTGLSPTPAWTAETNQINARLGRMVGTAGDVNADGYADVIIGAYSYTDAEIDEGIALVFHGSPTGLGPNGTPQNADWITRGNQPTAWYGRNGGTAGDVNGDGFSDVIVTAYRYSNGQSLEGAAFVYHGSPTGLSRTPNWTAESNQVNAAFGFSAGTAGDVNGDGYSDVIVGAVNFFGGQFWEGAAFVYAGSANGLASSPLWMTEGNQVEARLGWSTGGAGDINGDGHGDILVTSSLYDDDQINEGRVFVYYGSPTGPSAAPAWFADGNQAGSQFGYAASTAGDINGDGFADLAVGAYAFDNGQTNEGRAFVYFGNGGPGRGIVPQQRRTGSSTPIAHLGRSDSTSAMSLAAIGRTPFGRGRVKLEWEVKPLGVPLNATNVQRSAFNHDTGINDVTVNATQSGLACGTPYHWMLRLRYEPTSLPFAPHSHWVTMLARSRQTAGVRTQAVTGDMNCDCNVTLADLPAMVTALLDADAYAAAYPLCGPGADMQPDGRLNGADISAFVALLLDN